MFLVDCHTRGTRHLQGTRSIIAQRNTRDGVVTVLACRCRGHAVLVGGTQRLHRGPDELAGGQHDHDRSLPAAHDSGPAPTSAPPGVAA